jgi:serine/threonine protein kinase
VLQPSLFDSFRNNLPTKYDNIEPLTPGMNAAVFKAVDRILGRPVFLKKYPIVPGELAAAFREPQTAKDLTHDCLASIYSASDLSGTEILLEMELLTNGSIQNLLERSLATGRWPTAHRVLDFAIDAACGLAHLHKHGYIHRDIKPANLMLRRKDRRMRLVISDFGLARRIGDDGRAHASKHARLYRPPEAFEGAGYSMASDVYQLGMVVAQLFGCPVDYSLGSRSDAELCEAAKRLSIVDLDRIQPHVCGQVRKVIRDCLGAENLRTKTAGDLLVRLQNAKQSQMNWALTTTESGISLERRLRTGRVRVVVSSEGTRHSIRREQQRIGKSWRRQGSVVSVKHNDLSACRRLQQILST